MKYSIYVVGIVGSILLLLVFSAMLQLLWNESVVVALSVARPISYIDAFSVMLFYWFLCALNNYDKKWTNSK